MNTGLFYSLIPVVAYLCLVILLVVRNKDGDLRLLVLRAGILYVTYVILIEEVLSTFHGITRLGLLAAWSILILGLIGYLARLHLRVQGSHFPQITANRSYFGDFDPFGDFNLIFGATRLSLKIVDLPIRYRERKYGTTNIHR